MARSVCPDYEGAVYHVTSREASAWRSAVTTDPGATFLGILGSVVSGACTLRAYQSGRGTGC
jgi:hypothetical protein